ncbi:MAG: acylphosphatase [Desulfobacteraceae bacterium]|nr:MAG: acylphosphatase [Desulfobacteraceae bacterium]
MEMIRVKLIIKGRVQGVWFRDSTRRTAQKLRLSGWVRNLPDGSVEVLVEGPQEPVQKLVDWCRHGPATARVDECCQTPEEYRGEFQTFSIVF